jgi:hypothetical protein
MARFTLILPDADMPLRTAGRMSGVQIHAAVGNRQQ